MFVRAIFAGVAGSASYIVFMTDYETYAGVFTCQKLGFAHRQSASILSRSPRLDKMYVDKVRVFGMMQHE
jgi:apolipoprotein D and lipocalin family protein